MDLTSAISPERQRMMDYLTVRATSMTPQNLLARMRQATEEFEATIRGLDQELGRAAMPPGEWTIAEVVDHVAQTQIRAAYELRDLLEGRRPPGPPVYDALVSGAGRWASWNDLVAGVLAANAEFDRVLASASERNSSFTPTARTILVVNRKLMGGVIEPEVFEAELDWKGYAMVQRLHLLDHRTQVRKTLVATGLSQRASTRDSA